MLPRRRRAALLFTAAFLVLSATLQGVPAHAASFDCDASGLTANEKTICDHRDLNDMDVRMATLFRFLTGLFAMGARGEMEDTQRTWLKQRQTCGTDVACIRRSYENRIDQLGKIYDAIDKPI